MEDEEAMQPSTQQSLDEHKCGRNNSGMSKFDISDIICILHPSSPAAFRIVQSMAQRNPQHTPLNGRETTMIRQNDQLDEENNAQSLALRFSSGTINQDLGFIFGRNANLSDIIIASDSARHVSNTHFRIYLGDNGVLMLEDISTNGTLVDHVNLRGKLGMSPPTRMLCSGSTIEIFRSKQDEHVMFSVYLPSHKEHEEEYRRNYNAYLGRSGFAIRGYTAKNSLIGSNGKQFRGVIDAGPSSKKALLRSVSNPHSMHWNGGRRYNVVGLLKKGAFATMYMLATVPGGQLLVAKELDKKRLMKNGQTDHLLDNEMRIIRTLQHPNIVQNIDYQDAGNHFYIVTEYIHYGDLQDYLSSNGPLPEKLARSIAKQVLDALTYLHQKKIIHRNIKPESILIASMEPFVVKLTDFSLSKIVKNNNTFLKTFCGTLLYCAPEIFPYYRAPALNFHPYSQSVDIWSFAAVLWYALCCEPPFEGVVGYNEQGMFERVTGTQLDPTRLKEQGVSDEACGLLIAMLNVDPAQRLTEQQCLEHPWLVDNEMIPDFNNEGESEDAGDETE
ncbi:kinase-like protein, partial [Cenococcum geophilum 1.58]|uniref:kinase-like protein n=1 Tax=Cenococcum geophilum 1.58 TaxID=794803 RepID=UPI00358E12CC